MLIKMLSDNGTIHLWRTERDEKAYAASQTKTTDPPAESTAPPGTAAGDGE